MASVERTAHVLGSREGLTTLEQLFRFTGGGVDAAAIAGVLLRAPLTGSESIFGDRPGEEGPRNDSSRALRGFSPAPGFRFDVGLELQDVGVFRVQFSQPDRDVPYLQGELAWTVAAEGESAVFAEDINTERAQQLGCEPLTGARPSLRRWLFFRVGHSQVMSRAMANIAALLGPQAQ